MKAIEAINNLDGKETLSDQEKKSLNNLERNDYVQAKTELGDTTITVYDETKPIKDIVTEIAQGEMNPEGIRWENWAKIQAYLIANGQDLHGWMWKLWIDGSLWKYSREAIKNTKTITETETPTKTEKQETTESVETNNAILYSSSSELLNADLIDHLVADGTQWETCYNLLKESQDELGNPTYTLKQSYFNNKTNTFTIYYTSEETQKKESITIKSDEITSKNAKWQVRYNIEKFGESIADKINEEEQKLHRKKIEEGNKRFDQEIMDEGKQNQELINNGIKDFNYNTIKNPLIKEYFTKTQQHGKILQCSEGTISTITIQNKLTNTENKLKLTDITTNKQFDAQKFEQQLNKLYENSAISYIKENFNKRIQNFGDISKINLNTLNIAKTTFNRLYHDFQKTTIQEGEMLPRWEFQEQYATLSNLKQRLEKQETYLLANKKIEELIPEIEEAFDGIERLSKDTIKVENTIKLLKNAWITAYAENNGRDIVINNSNDIHTAFQNSNNESRYQNYIQQIQNITQEYSDVQVRTIN